MLDGNADLETLNSDNTTVSGRKETLVKGGQSTVLLKNNSLGLQSGKASVMLNGDKLTTSANVTRLNGKVSLGEPTIEPYEGQQEEQALAAAHDLINDLGII